MTTLRIHNFEPLSSANGPGVRAVVWVQGCTFNCPGCFNAETHSYGGQPVKVAALAAQIITLYRARRIEGLTISGGEPLQQKRAVTELLERVKLAGMTTILFTGYTEDEIGQMTNVRFKKFTDVLLAGRYDQAQRVAASLVGSSNKATIFLTDAYDAADLAAAPEAEIIIKADGTIFLTGINPIVLNQTGAAPGPQGIEVFAPDDFDYDPKLGYTDRKQGE